MNQRLSQWAGANYTDDSRPTVATLRKWAKDGNIPGAYQDHSKRWWVDTTANKLKDSLDDAVAALPAEYQGMFGG